MDSKSRGWRTIICLTGCIFSISLLMVSKTWAQLDTPNPTPIIIALTPDTTATAVPVTATVVGGGEDRFEPNNDVQHAVTIGIQTVTDLTLTDADVDFFTLFLKAGQMVRVDTAVYEGLDTRLTLVWEGQVVAENDDRSAMDLGSTVVMRAATDGWLLIYIGQATVYNGRYDLTITLVEPTATMTPMPTATATTTATPSSSPTPSVQPTASIPVATFPIAAAPDPLPTTTAVSTTTRISLTVQHMGEVSLALPAVTTPIRLLVYYDANNDRQPSPNEGVANVSVVAVDGQGQRLAQLFTNRQGEAIFNLTSAAVSRIIVPFVPGWSARVRVGEANHGIVLGLPAVRLPIFLPVQELRGEEE